MSFTQIVVHGPEKEEDTQKLLHEISAFRAEKTMKYLEAMSVPPSEVARMINELQIPPHD